MERVMAARTMAALVTAIRAAFGRVTAPNEQGMMLHVVRVGRSENLHHPRSDIVRQMKSGTISATLLVAILCYYGWMMSRNARALDRRVEQQQLIASRNRTLLVQSERGIDAFGHPVDSLPADADERTVTFLLHGQHLTTDLEFWLQVESLLPKNSTVRLIAYCDGEVCVNAIRHAEPSPNFPVLAYGEITSSQAVINADMDGDSILQIGSGLGLRKIPWRAQRQTPQRLVSSLIP